MKTENISQNPLLLPLTLKNHAIAFPDIKPEHFLPALNEAIARAKKNIELIKNHPESPNFKNSIEALELASDDLSLITSIFHSNLSAHTNPELQELAKKVGPIVSAFKSDIILDEVLFEKIKFVWESSDKNSLDREEFKLLENTFKEFARNGALLEEEKRKRLREIDEKLSILTPHFSENVLNATNEFELIVENESELSGLPESAKESAAQDAEAKGHKGKWLFTLQAPSFLPVLRFVDSRELRHKVGKAYASRCCEGTFSNKKTVKDIVSLRLERAQILGYNSHSHFVLDERMAESPEKVTAFLQKLLNASKPAALKELDELREFAKSIGDNDELTSWDIAYYSEKLKEKKFQFNAEELRPYFQLENVIDGAFQHANKLYGVSFSHSNDYPTYHEDVRVYEVTDSSSQEFIGLLYTDFFPRDSKRGGAWMTAYRDQGLFRQEILRPQVGVVCNFTKPTKNKPSLLTFMEVETLFHEFGHALHGLLSHCKYRSLAGTNVYWDFVELPSQIFENWVLEKEGLDLFAKHFETGEELPESLCRKIKESSKFMAGYHSLRQINFASLDMAWHSLQNMASVSSVEEFEAEATRETTLLPSSKGTLVSPAFSHIFAGGYSSGYYSYKWAEVLDADAFEYFLEKGLFNQEVAQSFKSEILMKGGTEHPMDLYKNFRGREPDPNALLRRDGLI